MRYNGQNKAFPLSEIQQNYSGRIEFMSTSDKGTEADWAEKAAIAKESFKEVLASDEHEDSKAQRILTAMAFLTAAAGLIFAELNRTGIGASLKFPIFNNYAYISVCFFTFVMTMLIGTLFFLAALGPAFNVPRDKRSYPASLLFSQLILQGTKKEWEKHWEEHSVDELQVEIAKNYVIEAYLLAQKVRFKFISMIIGKSFYKLSLGFLGLLVVPVFTTHVNQVYSLAAWIFAVGLILDVGVRAASPPAWEWRLWKWQKSMFKRRNLLSINLFYTLVELSFGIFLIILGITSWIG